MTAEPTPRTDAICSPSYRHALADLARQLERELQFVEASYQNELQRANRLDEMRLTLERELSLAQSRLAEVEKDAARYRWLRNDSEKHFVPAPTGTMRSGVGIKVIYDYPTVKVPCTAMLDGDNLDAAIDEAIKRSS